MKLDSKAESRRLELLGLSPGTRYDGGIKSFEGLDVERLERLLAEGLATPDGKQNEAPTIAEFLEFMRSEPRTRAHGYVVSPRRADCRVSIEGLEIKLKPGEEAKDLRHRFVVFCRTADELCDTGDKLYSWWD